MDQPRNHGTFLVIYIDATSNISSWGKAPQLLDILDDVLGWEHFVNRTQILGPEALRPLRYQVPLVPWPTINELMSQGKRFLLLTRTNLRSEYAFMQPEVGRGYAFTCAPCCACCDPCTITRRVSGWGLTMSQAR